VETGILHHPEASELQDSDYESVRDPTGHKLHAFTASESDTEISEDTTSSLPSRQEYYRYAEEAIRDVDGFEQENSNLCQDLWALFGWAQGFNLASWFIQCKVPKSRINEYSSSGLGSSALIGYNSINMLENHLRLMNPHSSYLQWFEGEVEDSKRTLPFFYRKGLDCIRYRLRQITYQDDLVNAPRRELDPNAGRSYVEGHTVDWW